MRDLILIHGALETSEVMKPLMEKLAPLFRCHLFTCSGHGKGKIPQEFRIQTFVDELANYIIEHKIQGPTIVGHSMGGYIALALASQDEEISISRIVCYGTKFDWSEEEVAKMLVQLHPENEALMDHLKKVFGEEASRLLAATTHMISHIKRLDGLTPVDLEDITIPVDLVIGDKDKVVSVVETQDTLKHLSQGQMHVLKDSRHEMERCQLDQLVGIIAGQ